MATKTRQHQSETHENVTVTYYNTPATQRTTGAVYIGSDLVGWVFGRTEQGGKAWGHLAGETLDRDEVMRSAYEHRTMRHAVDALLEGLAR